MDGRRLRWAVLGVVVAVVATGWGCAGRPQPAAPADAASVYRVTGALVNLLACPSVTCAVVEDLGEGQQVVLQAAYPGGWAEVRTVSSGREGFVLRRFLARP